MDVIFLIVTFLSPPKNICLDAILNPTTLRKNVLIFSHDINLKPKRYDLKDIEKNNSFIDMSYLFLYDGVYNEFSAEVGNYEIDFEELFEIEARPNGSGKIYQVLIIKSTLLYSCRWMI